jgi:hypothetical protein
MFPEVLDAVLMVAALAWLLASILTENAVNNPGGPVKMDLSCPRCVCRFESWISRCVVRSIGICLEEVFSSGKGVCKARRRRHCRRFKKGRSCLQYWRPGPCTKRATLSFYISKFRSSPLLPTTTLSRLTCLSLSQVYSSPRQLIQCDHANVRFKDDRLTAPGKDTQSCVVQTAEVSLIQGSRSVCLCTVRLTCVSGGPFLGHRPLSRTSTRAQGFLHAPPFVLPFIPSR